LEKAGADSELTVKLEKLHESANISEELITIAAEHGFTVTETEIEDAKSLTKKNELDEEKLEAVAGGTGEGIEESIAGTVNRYCPEWCKNLKEARWACYFPVFWCDHFSREYYRSDYHYSYYYYGCAKGAYPTYLKKEPND